MFVRLLSWTVLSGLTFATVHSLQAETILVPSQVSSIQKAINRAKPGDVVLVKPGTYREAIVLKPRVLLKSEGNDRKGKIGLLRAEKTIIEGTETMAVSAVVMAEGSAIDGFTIRNVGKFDQVKWTEHEKTQGNNQSHEHIGNRTIAPIYASCNSCEVLHLIVHDNGYSGILIDGEGKETRPMIRNNVCFRNMGAGISVRDKTVAEIVGNRCYENFYAGIGHNNSNPYVHHNECFKNIRAGIGVSNGACPLIKNNRCFENLRAGIGVRTGEATRPMIEGNHCYENKMAGIGSEEDARPVISGNRCYKNKLAGIGCREHASPTIIGNQSFENGKAGIGCEANTSSLIIDNQVERNQAAGIGFAPGGKGSAVVLNNRVTENRLVAIGIHPGWKVELVGNQLKRSSGMPPLVMVHQGATAKFVDNRLEGGGVAGIRTAGKVTIELCQLKGIAMRKGGPPNFGIWGLPGSEIQCSDSVITRFRHALSANDAKIQINNCTVEEFYSAAFRLEKPRKGSSVNANRIVASTKNDKIFFGDALPPDQMQDNQLTVSQKKN